MTARNDTYALMQQLSARGLNPSFEDANTLRRAQLTLSRWAEMECGDSGPFSSWSIERDEVTQIPYFCVYPHNRPMYRRRIADKEAGALRRVAAVCEHIGAHFYHQTDPRGCALYVSAEPVKDDDYTRGVACCA
jgi:hypothetical protein